jgi:hypothetical protein
MPRPAARLFRATDAVVEAALVGTEIAVLETRERGAETNGALVLSVLRRIGLRARGVRSAADRPRVLAGDARVQTAALFLQAAG